MGNVVGAYIGCGIVFVLFSPLWLFFHFLGYFYGDSYGPGPYGPSGCIETVSNTRTTPIVDDGGGGGGGRRHHNLRFLLEADGGAPPWYQEESPRSLEWIKPIATTTAAAASDGGKK